MRACHRGAAPALLADHGAQIGLTYAARRRADPRHQYRWRPDLYASARTALGEMTQERCAYCDGYPFGDLGEEQIDHFRPASRDEFFELACSWDNLFLVCQACNKAKLDTWDDQLLRPDADGFSFERYFEYRDLTGEILPNRNSGVDDQLRARRTIEILDLNRRGKCLRRKETAVLIRAAVRSGASPDDGLAQDLGHRFLIPLCT